MQYVDEKLTLTLYQQWNLQNNVFHEMDARYFLSALWLSNETFELIKDPRKQINTFSLFAPLAGWEPLAMLIELLGVLSI